MGKLTWRLGRAFTKSRKSSPAEFLEVENQLYSISAALCALRDACSGGDVAISVSPPLRAPNSETQRSNVKETIDQMLQGCEETLKHLEGIVNKYGIIGELRDLEQPLFKRWSRDLKNNWKKISWTTEQGDLAALRSQLTIHTNSLNLVLGIEIKYVPRHVVQLLL